MTVRSVLGYAVPAALVAVAWLVTAKLRCAAAAPEASGPVPSSAAIHDVFDDIYKSARWGKNDAGVGNSGTGSKLQATLIYRTFLQQFMKDNDIHSVVDAGCGDWEFSQAIDWTGIDYKGYDIVESVIAEDTKRYASSNIHFFTGNIVEADLPAADLLVSKHVLQHLPNAAVKQFLTQLPKYKYVLLTNGVEPRTLSAPNTDIAAGDYRPLDLTRPPFSLPGANVLTYWGLPYWDGSAMHQVFYMARKK
jgi:SAM-dependent methyltransferase